jgi:hypothetical protein
MKPPVTPAYSPPTLSPAHEEVEPLLTSTKFGILCLATAGLYSIWWQYKAWRFFKQRQQSAIWPVARVLFSLSTINELLKNIGRFSASVGLPPAYSAGNLAAGYIVLSLLARLPAPYWLVAVLSFTFLLAPFQQFANALQQSPEYATREQSGFSTRQVLVLAAGGLLWAMALYGASLPD